MLRIICLVWIFGCAIQANAQPFPPVSLHKNDFTVVLTPNAKELPLSIFPNPMTDVLTVHLKDVHPDMIYYVQILGISGESVLQTPINSTQTQLDLSHLPAGWYIVHLHTGTKRTTQRVFKMTGP